VRHRSDARTRAAGVAAAVALLAGAALAGAPPAGAGPLPLGAAHPLSAAQPLSTPSPLGAPTLLRAPGSVPSSDPGAVADAALDRTIHDQQVLLVTRASSIAVLADETEVTRYGRVLSDDQAVLARDRVAHADASAALIADQRAETAGVAALGTAVAIRSRDDASVAADSRRLQALAVGWYVGVPSEAVISGGSTLAEAQQRADDAAELSAITAAEEAAEHHDLAAATAAAAAQRSRQAQLAQEQAALTAAIALKADSAEVLAADTTGVDSAEQEVIGALAALARAHASQAAALAGLDGPEGSSADPVPTILGRAALTAAQLATWFDASGYLVETTSSIRELAADYISEGSAEGVRGDIAFAQAMVETGGFSSPDAITANNYAGIGHCDSCGSGLRFPSPLEGVRAQIQLLRTYADSTLTASQLAAPPVLASLDPAAQGRRGCCTTWNALTGVWATDPNYGLTILDVYEEILAYTVRADPGGAD
jgi:hypothetical protein